MKLRKIDWIIIGILLILGLIPVDPTDIADFGTPALEFCLAFMYYWWRTRKHE